MTISRRDLFRVFRRSDEVAPVEAEVALAPSAPSEATIEPTSTEEVAASGFSLEAFYAARTPAALPPFTVKVTDSDTPTTRVGLGRTTGIVAPDPSSSTNTAPGTTSIAVPRIAASMVPRVLPHRCLATTSFCSVCVERCPIEGAITVTHGRPQVTATRCDGCGICIAACPAPILAFELRPRGEATS